MKQECMNVLMAINKNYLAQMKALICSLGENNRKNIDVYLIHNELSASDIIATAALLKKVCGGNLHEIKVSDKFLEGAKVNEHFSIEMYYRIFATELLPTDLERILWLDADIVTIKSIEGLYNTDLQGNSIAACVHRERYAGHNVINDQAVNRLEMDLECKYFNSGVLLMDLQKIRENFNKEEAIELIYQKEAVLENPDQDILNLLYCHDVLMLDESIYNYQVHYDWDAVNERQHIQDHAVVLHYVGPAKPWKPTSYHFTYEYYWKYFLQCGSPKEYKKYKVALVSNQTMDWIKKIAKKVLHKCK